MKYGYTKKVKNKAFDDTIETVKKLLATEGFGVLTEINVQATLKKKIGVAYDRYIILGACNPEFAHKALCAEKEIGLLLPCNVIVYEDQDSIYVSAVMPTIAMSAVENRSIEPIAHQVETKLKNIINAL